MSPRSLRVLSCALGLAGWIALLSPQPCAAQDDDSLELDENEEGEAAPSGAQDGSEEAPAAEEGDAPPGPTPAPDPEPSAEDTGTDLVARVSVGGGLGVRSFRRPVAGGVQRLNNVYFPVADFGIWVRMAPQEAFTLDVQIRYQTSLGLVIDEPVMFALNNQLDVRSEHAELSVAPGFRLGENQSSPRITIPVGGVFRNFWPADHHLQTPRYTLFGAMARIQLEASLGSVVRLRAGPEVQVYGVLGSDLTDNGVSVPGFAYGGEASLEFRLNQTFLIEVHYRQSNAVASAAAGRPSFLDVERFATIRLAGEM